MMRVWDRLLVALSGLLLLCGAVLFAFWLVSDALFGDVWRPLAELRTTVGGYWGLWAAPLLLLLLALCSIWLAFRRPPKVSGVLQVNEMGTLTITRESIENLVQQALATIRGIAVQTLRIKTNEAGEIQISLVLNADGEQDFPSLVETVQAQVKERVEMITGVMVRAIHVEISRVQTRSTPPVTKPRVE